MFVAQRSQAALRQATRNVEVTCAAICCLIAVSEGAENGVVLCVVARALRRQARRPRVDLRCLVHLAVEGHLAPHMVHLRRFFDRANANFELALVRACLCGDWRLRVLRTLLLQVKGSHGWHVGHCSG